MTEEPQELSETDKARSAAARAAADELSSALRNEDPEETAAAAGQFLQAINALAPDKILDKLHVPDDAGEYRDALIAILLRIPERWGRWISCGPGWYPLITDLDQRLAAIDPNYEIHQVKEKFGGLRYYFGASDPTLHNAMQTLADETEQRSTKTCEECGNTGAPHTSETGWRRTLCASCASAANYAPSGNKSPH